MDELCLSLSPFLSLTARTEEVEKQLSTATDTVTGSITGTSDAINVSPETLVSADDLVTRVVSRIKRTRAQADALFLGDKLAPVADVERFAQIERLVFESLAQGFAFDKFADDIVRIFRRADLVDD